MTRKKTHNEVVWLYPVLSRLGVTGFESNLSGSGDSGSIDDITFLKGDEYVQEANEQDSVDADVGVAIKRFHAPPGTFVKKRDLLFEINPVRVLRDLKTAQDLVEDLRREKTDLRESREAAETLLSEIERALEIEASVEAELVRIKTAQDLVEELRRERADLRESRTAAETLLSEIETALESVRAGANDHGTDARSDGGQVQNGQKPVADEDAIKALELDAEKIREASAAVDTRLSEIEASMEAELVRMKTAQDLVEELRREGADLRESRTAAETLLSEIETALESVRAGANDHGTDARNDGGQVQNGQNPVSDEEIIKALEKASAAVDTRLSEIEASVEAELVRIANLSAEAMYTEVRAEKDGFVTWTNTDLIGAELEEVQEAVQIAPLSEIELILSHLTIDDGTKRDQTFWTALEEMIEREAVGLGNFYDNEGGSVWLKYELNPENAEIEVEESSFVENEPEYDYEDEEDDLDDLDNEIEP